METPALDEVIRETYRRITSDVDDLQQLYNERGDNAINLQINDMRIHELLKDAENLGRERDQLIHHLNFILESYRQQGISTEDPDTADGLTIGEDVMTEIINDNLTTYTSRVDEWMRRKEAYYNSHLDDHADG